MSHPPGGPACRRIVHRAVRRFDPMKWTSWMRSQPNAGFAEVPYENNDRCKAAPLPISLLLGRIHRLIHPPTPTMPFTFQRRIHLQRLHEALQSADPSSDGFSEVTLNDGRASNARRFLSRSYGMMRNGTCSTPAAPTRSNRTRDRVSFPGRRLR
ncbi:MAG: hypothetical protein MZV63_06905 [Marinilabiliales bacterium]|nr:hypothetical protein [Marinilabiliales bacterium]